MYHKSLLLFVTCALNLIKFNCGSPVADVESNSHSQKLQANEEILNSPPEYMLQLYSDLTLSSPEVDVPYGATSVTAISSSGGRGSYFSFIIPESIKLDFVQEVEFHLHHGTLHISDREGLPYKASTLQVWVETPDREEVARQWVQTTSGWVQFKLGKKFIARQNCEGISCLPKLVTLHVFAETLTGEKLKIKLHHGDVKHNRKPLLVVFSKELNNLEETFPQITSQFVPKPDRNKRSTDSSTSRNNTLSSMDASCHLEPMKVVIEELNWNSRVIAPETFNANMCVGTCSFPLSQDMHPSNHAIVLGIMNYLNKIPYMPLCVPTKYSDLSVLYLDPDDIVVFRRFSGMVAEQCGCR